MTPLDKNYLSLQFWNKIYQLNGIEFQSFSEKIMEKAFKGFQKIRPYGKAGDKGNDGYRPAEGIYYQMYAPADPSEKEADAAGKFKEDFSKLKNGWDTISKIEELNFVYNDKGSGVTEKLEAARAELKVANPEIEFKIFTPKNLEDLFFTLSSDKILSLGFDIDSRNAIKNVRGYLEKLDAELDKESGAFVLRVLSNIKDIIAGQNDEGLLLDYEILEARALQKNEEVIESRSKYESIRKRYPDDPRAFLYLAEIYLNNEDFEKNNELLTKAEKINPDYWLLKLERLVREIRLGTNIDPTSIDERNFPDEPKARSNFYRIYAVIFERLGDIVKAQSFVERAIQFNPVRFANYDVKISLLADKVIAEEDSEKRQSVADAVLREIEKVEERFNEGGGLSPRSQVLLNIRKLHMYLSKEDYSSIEVVAKETFGLVLDCHLDYLTEKLIADLIHVWELPQADFEKLKSHLKKAEKPIADVLAKVMVLQFLQKNTHFTEGKEFFSEIKKQNIVDFISAVENKNYKEVVTFLKDDIRFAVDFALGNHESPELRRKIIESLPDDGSVKKEKLFLILSYEEGDLDGAFAILQKMDLSKLGYIESLTTLKIAREKKAWDSVIFLIERLLSHEKDKKAALRMRLQLFTANFNLERFPEVVRIGNSVLENPEEMKLMDDGNTEILVAQTTYAFLKRNDPNARAFIEIYSPFLKSFEGKISAETEVYLRAGDAKNALRSVVEGIKMVKHPSPEQYGMLFFVFSQIGNMMSDFNLTSSDEVIPDSFVKLKDQERWFYIGEGEELDATKVDGLDENHAMFIGKKLGEGISFPNKYRSENPEFVIETILPIEKYILWQSTHCAQRLSVEHRWDAMEMIEIPTSGGSIDTKYLIAKMEDEAKERGDFFKLYCEQDAPLALLALNEGGLTNAIGRIASEQKGFIKMSTGSVEEMNQQREVAKRMVAGETFYLDGTSALLLSETGLFTKINGFLLGLKVPQSVISLLLEVEDKFRYIPGQAGRMAYINGRITISDLDKEKINAIKANFETSIKLLEGNPKNISIISSANKSSAFSEQKVAPSLADACILAHRENVPILTEDFFYLKMNEIETNKPASEYCSSIILLRVLYEQGKVSFEEYLGYFAYLSSYRARFLSLTTEDLEKAVFGDGLIRVVRPEQLRKFNFPLTLSEEYGVTPRAAFQVVGSFLIKVLLDDSVLRDTTQRIFAEIVTAFPTKENRKSFGRILLVVAVQTINQDRQRLIVGTRLQEKVEAINAFLAAYTSSSATSQ